MFKFDDALDAFGIHAVGGIWGTLATGLFADKVINAAGSNGLLLGNPRQFLVQGLLVVAPVVYAVTVTLIIYKFVDVLIGMRVTENEELIGLDLTQHKEAAYTVLD